MVRISTLAWPSAPPVARTRRLGRLARRSRASGAKDGANQHLDEELVAVGEVLDERQRGLAVDGDDAAEGALGVAREGAVVLGHIGGNGRRRALVLEDDDAGLVELADRVPRGLGVEVQLS